MVILTDKGGHEIRELDCDFDIDLNKSRDFALEFSSDDDVSDIEYGCRVFVPDTEYGGIITGVISETVNNMITYTGLSWRGILNKKVIKPVGDHRTESGDVLTIIGALIAEAGITTVFDVAPGLSGKTVTNYEFPRYCTMLDGITSMLDKVDARLKVTYIQGDQGDSGYVLLDVTDIVDYSLEIELSQDAQLNFTAKEDTSGCTHLVCLGKGELSARITTDLYLQLDGTIGYIQQYFGLNDYTEVYENTGSETVEDLEEKGREKFEELISSASFTMDLADLDIDVEIGDIIGGRDYITGLTMTHPVTNKIYTVVGGVVSIQYSIDGEADIQEIE